MATETTFSQDWGTDTAYAITADALGSGNSYQGPSLNLASLFGGNSGVSDLLIQGSFKTASGSLGSNACIQIWVATLGPGSALTDGATGSNQAFTMPTTPNLLLLDTININTANTQTTGRRRSLAAA